MRTVTMFCLMFIASWSYANDYAAARAELVAAYQAEDYEAMRIAANKGRSLL